MQGIIYKVTNTETNETYIGATTRSIDERKKDHIQKSFTGKGYDFQNAIATYGVDVFIWEQIDTANNSSELAEKEIKYISEFESKVKGYNGDKGGGFKKTVYKYNLDGSLNGIYSNLTLAAESVGANKKQISKACWSVSHTLKGFLWSYLFKDPFTPEIDLRKKKVIQYDLEGKVLATYISVAEASRIIGLSKTCISRCCRGEREQSGGFIWQYDKV